MLVRFKILLSNLLTTITSLSTLSKGIIFELMSFFVNDSRAWIHHMLITNILYYIISYQYIMTPGRNSYVVSFKSLCLLCQYTIKYAQICNVHALCKYTVFIVDGYIIWLYIVPVKGRSWRSHVVRHLNLINLDFISNIQTHTSMF